MSELQRGQDLINSCRAYCSLTGLKRVTTTDEKPLMVQAVLDYDGDIGGLNDFQRQVIAGMDDLLKED